MINRIKNTFKPDSYYKYFLISLIVSGLSFGLYKGVIDNYLAEIVQMGEFDRGLTEFFRELPGLLLVFILAAFCTCTAEKMYKAGALITLAGMGMLCIVPPEKIAVIAALFLYSLGDHIQFGMKPTITLEYAKRGKGGEAQGYQNAIYQIGMLGGYAVIIVAFIILADKKPYKPVFAVSLFIMAISTLISLKIKGNSQADDSKNRFYFKKKFKKYYMLEVFYGARKQVFLTFGPYVLVLFYGASATVISILFAVSAISCFICAPLVGKLIDRIGYKTIMIADTLILVIVCFFYGFAHHIFSMNVAFIVCCINYVLDSIISLASMASNVYVQDISDSPKEVRATISTGISVNHLISILIALFGGYIWATLGIEMLFILSAVLGLCNSAYAASIKVVKKETAALESK